MKTMFKKSFMLMIVFTLVMLQFSGIASATQANVSLTDEEKEIEELAEKLEFMFEEAIISDGEGGVTLDFDKIEEKYGSSQDLEALKIEVESTDITCEVDEGDLVTTAAAKGSDAVNKCMNDKIKNNWKDFIGVAAFATAIDYAISGDYTSAAKKLVKAGVRGNVVSIAGTLAWYFSSCLVTHGNNPWN